MRTTKALLCAAAVAAGAVTAMAQSNVYSLNVVGYINLPLTEGFNMVANQLDVDGTGTNNTISGVFSSNLPINSVIYTWAGAGYNPATSYVLNKSGVPIWTGDNKLNPGQGCWVSVPVGAYGGATQSVTTVGNVLQGSLVNPNIPPAGGFALVSSMAPLAGGLQTTLKYTPKLGDIVYTYHGAYDPAYSYVLNKSGVPIWTPNEPSISVGQGFWLSTSAGSVWSNNFVVQ